MKERQFLKGAEIKTQSNYISRKGKKQMEKAEQTIKNLAALLTESEKLNSIYWKRFREMQDKYITLEDEYKALKAEKEKGMW